MTTIKKTKPHNHKKTHSGSAFKGQTTISPPSKVKNESSSPLILASGFDTLNLAIDVHWKNTDFFDLLTRAKDQAKETRKDVPIEIPSDSKNYHWNVNVKSHGTNGYEWLIGNKEFTLKIGAWRQPHCKPSILAEIRSEALWHLGAESALQNIILLLLAQGGTKILIKPSRVDLCADVLMLEDSWGTNLLDYARTRSTYIATHFSHRKLTGISIAKGAISARLYDKPLEIQEQSNKFWMYDIWGLSEVPEGRKVIRVEYQLRREMLGQLAINTIDDLFLHYDKIWAYCTQKWLKFQTPGKHHTQRKILPWWKTLQNGFRGKQNPKPLVRSKSIQYDIDQNTTQAIGHMRSLIAARQSRFELDSYEPAEIEDALSTILRKINFSQESKDEFAQSVIDKKARHQRTVHKFLEAEKERKKLGFRTEL